MKNRPRSLLLFLVGFGIPLLYQQLFVLFGSMVPHTFLTPFEWNALHYVNDVLFVACPLIALRASTGGSATQVCRMCGLTWPKRLDAAVAMAGGLLAIVPLELLYYGVVSHYGAVLSFEYPQSAQAVVPFVLLAVVCAPIAEETFFRGYLATLKAPAWLAWGTPWWYVVGSALLWSGLHMDVLSLLPLLWTGIVYARMRLYSGSVVPSIALHAGLNAVVLLAYFVAR